MNDECFKNEAPSFLLIKVEKECHLYDVVYRLLLKKNNYKRLKPRDAKSRDKYFYFKNGKFNLTN